MVMRCDIAFRKIARNGFIGLAKFEYRSRDDIKLGRGLYAAQEVRWV